MTKLCGRESVVTLGKTRSVENDDVMRGRESVVTLGNTRSVENNNVLRVRVRTYLPIPESDTVQSRNEARPDTVVSITTSRDRHFDSGLDQRREKMHPHDACASRSLPDWVTCKHLVNAPAVFGAQASFTKALRMRVTRSIM
jgi:hypothetical protein